MTRNAYVESCSTKFGSDFVVHEFEVIVTTNNNDNDEHKSDATKFILDSLLKSTYNISLNEVLLGIKPEELI